MKALITLLTIVFCLNVGGGANITKAESRAEAPALTVEMLKDRTLQVDERIPMGMNKYAMMAVSREFQTIPYRENPSFDGVWHNIWIEQQYIVYQEALENECKGRIEIVGSLGVTIQRTTYVKDQHLKIFEGWTIFSTRYPCDWCFYQKEVVQDGKLVDAVRREYQGREAGFMRDIYDMCVRHFKPQSDQLVKLHNEPAM